MIIEAVRTPLGKRGGGLAGVHPGELLGHVQREVLKRSGVDPALVEQVVGGVVSQAGEQSNDMVRRAWLHAGLPSPPARPPSTRSAARASSRRTSSTT